MVETPRLEAKERLLRNGRPVIGDLFVTELELGRPSASESYDIGIVIPVKTGIQDGKKRLDSCLCRNDVQENENRWSRL